MDSPDQLVVSPLSYRDAHNHLQDERLSGRVEELMRECRRVGVVRMVVNGSCEEDWPQVAELARQYPEVLPSFGYHPWYLAEASPTWFENWQLCLEKTPGAVVGEIGLDRWMMENPERWRRYRGGAAAFVGEPPSMELQEEIFVRQWRVAAERNLPASVHCLRAFGRLQELIASEPRPAVGFLLHSYGGPAEMVPEWVRLGAYFGFPGAFLEERKQRQQEVFRAIPWDRLLVETDAPDQVPPASFRTLELTGPAGESWQHPANLSAVYAGLAGVLGISLERLVDLVEGNFRRLLGV